MMAEMLCCMLLCATVVSCGGSDIEIPDSY